MWRKQPQIDCRVVVRDLGVNGAWVWPGIALTFVIKNHLVYIRGYWGKRSALDSNEYHKGPWFSFHSDEDLVSGKRDNFTCWVFVRWKFLLSGWMPSSCCIISNFIPWWRERYWPHICFMMLCYPRTWHFLMTCSKNSQHMLRHFSLYIRYFILLISIIQVFIALYTMSSRGGTEAFVSLWSAIFLLILCAGGTVIMRKFQSSLAVGFFMGSVVAASQMFLLIFLMWVQLAVSLVTHSIVMGNDVIFIAPPRSFKPCLIWHIRSFSLFGYIEDRLENNLPVDGERLNGFVCLVQSLLLGSFAAILAAHRSEILDQKISDEDDVTYEAPARTDTV